MADDLWVAVAKSQVRVWVKKLGAQGVVNLVNETIRESAKEEFRKCGKTNCKCARGELHGPYLYFEYRDGGRVKRQYLGKA